jgi:hypothetical protein
MDPFEVLGLGPDERDERNVRRAYARLIRQHRPDRDPEGFRRVREAYEEVLFRIRAEAFGAAIEAAGADEPAASNELPRPAFDDASTDEATPPGDPVDLEEALSRYGELQKRKGTIGSEDLSADDLRTVDAWQKAVLAALEDDPSRLAGGITNQDLHFEIESGSPLVSSQIVGRWAETGSPQLVTFAESFLERAKHPSASVDWGLCLMLTQSLSLTEVGLAERLTNEYFRNHPQGAFSTLDVTEAQLLLGRAVRRWSPKARRRLTRAINAEKWPSQPRDVIDQEILARTADMPNGPARVHLKTILPGLVARAGGRVNARQRRRLAAKPSGGEGSVAKALYSVVFVLVVIGALTRLLDGPEPPPQPPSVPHVPKMPDYGSDYGAEIQKILQSSSRELETRRPFDLTKSKANRDIGRTLQELLDRHRETPRTGSGRAKFLVYAGCQLDTPARQKALDLIDRVGEGRPSLQHGWNVLVVAILRTKDADVRRICAKGLSESLLPGSIDPLLEAYKKGDDGIRPVLRKILPKLGPADTRRVRRAFASR